MGEYVVASIVNHERRMLQVYENQHASLWSQEGSISEHRIIADLNIAILGTGTIGVESEFIPSSISYHKEIVE